MVSDLEALILIPADSHAAANSMKGNYTERKLQIGGVVKKMFYFFYIIKPGHLLPTSYAYNQVRLDNMSFCLRKFVFLFKNSD